MKKISYLSIFAFISVITITMYFYTSTYILKQNTGINSWLCIILSNIIGIIPLILIIYISKYKDNLNIYEKIKDLFGNTNGTIINITISIILFLITINILYNTCDFVISQFLYKTPIIISMTLLTSLVIYNNTKGINVISKVSLLLIILNIILFMTSFISEIKDINLDNFLPLLKENTNNIIPTTLKITSINTLPLFTILVIPKNNITNKNKYNKTIIISYLISSIISLLIIFQMYGVLGKYLVKVFEYPEYMLLKRIKLFGFLERVENIISVQWIIGSYIYMSLLVYNISKTIYPNKNNISNYAYIITGILLIIITTLIYKNNTILSMISNNILPYITSTLLIFYIIISLKIFLHPKKI